MGRPGRELAGGDFWRFAPVAAATCASSFDSPCGLAQDFACWLTPAKRLNFGRVEETFDSLVAEETMKTKLRKIGSGYGVLLPKRVIDNLRLSEGTELELTEHEWGLELSPFDLEFSKQVEAFLVTEGRHRNSYRALGESKK